MPKNGSGSSQNGQYMPWMKETIDLKKERNFFETRVTEYQGGGTLSWDEDDNAKNPQTTQRMGGNSHKVPSTQAGAKSRNR